MDPPTFPSKVLLTKESLPCITRLNPHHHRNHFSSASKRKKPSSSLSWKVKRGTGLKAAKTHDIPFREKKATPQEKKIHIVHYQPTGYEATKSSSLKVLTALSRVSFSGGRGQSFPEP